MDIFIIYALIFRLAIISSGIFAIYIGYRLFVLGVMPGKGTDIDAEKDGIRLSVKNAAPGTCFATLGVIAICIMIFQGNPEYNISLKDGQVSFSIRGNGITANQSPDIPKTQLTNDQILKIDKTIKELLSNNFIKKEAAEPLLKIAAIYFKQQWYDHAIVLTNLVIELNSQNITDARNLREKIINARGY
jgi:hypothetical protein